MTDFMAASPYRLAAAACAAAIYLSMSHHQAGAGDGGSRTTGSPSRTVAVSPPKPAATKFDPLRDFPHGTGIAVGSWSGTTRTVTTALSLALLRVRPFLRRHGQEHHSPAPASESAAQARKAL